MPQKLNTVYTIYNKVQQDTASFTGYIIECIEHISYTFYRSPYYFITLYFYFSFYLEYFQRKLDILIQDSTTAAGDKYNNKKKITAANISILKTISVYVWNITISLNSYRVYR